MISNLDIFFDFLGDNFLITDYLSACRKRYSSMDSLFDILFLKCKTNPKGMFGEVLGKNHKFKKAEEKWIRCVDDTINYVPQCGDKVYCCTFDRENCERVCFRTHFLEGTKEKFTDMGGNTFENLAFIKKI